MTKRGIAPVTLSLLCALAVFLMWRWQRAPHNSLVVTYWGRPSDIVDYLRWNASAELAGSIVLCLSTAVISLIVAGVLAVVLLMLGSLSATGLRIMERFAALSQTVPTLVIVTIFLLLERQLKTALHIKELPLMLYCLGPVTVSLLFPPLVNGADAITRLSIDLKSLLRLWGAPAWARTYRVYIPAAIPQILTGVRTSATWAVGATLLTEGLISAVEGDSSSLGHYLLRAFSEGTASRTTSVFIIATALAFFVYVLAMLGQRGLEMLMLGRTAITHADYPLQNT